MKKSFIAGIAAALVVATGVGATTMAYAAGQSAGSQITAIESSVDAGTAASKVNDTVTTDTDQNVTDSYGFHKGAQEEHSEKSHDTTDMEQKTFYKKLSIKDAIRAELDRSKDGTLSQESIDYIKGLLAGAKAEGMNITFTDNDINSLKLCDADVAALGLQIVD